MYQTILVPTDFVHKEQTIAALQKPKNSQIMAVLCYCMWWMIFLLMRLGEIPENIIVNIAEDQVRKAFTELQEIADKAAITAQVEVRQGRAYSNIIDSAKELMRI